jgi:protein-tyrosine phosphatase
VPLLLSAAARKRGVFLTSRSRPLKPLDLSHFSYIIGMDAKNERAITQAAEYWLKASKPGMDPDFR